MNQSTQCLGSVMQSFNGVVHDNHIAISQNTYICLFKESCKIKWATILDTCYSYLFRTLEVVMDQLKKILKKGTFEKKKKKRARICSMCCLIARSPWWACPDYLHCSWAHMLSVVVEVVVAEHCSWGHMLSTRCRYQDKTPLTLGGCQTTIRHIWNHLSLYQSHQEIITTLLKGCISQSHFLFKQSPLNWAKRRLQLECR